MAIICLNMIVKNEAHVIRRGLDTVKPFIHTWVIVDTGSTDGTQEIIREHMKDIPGELHERPWKNFAHNRNEAMDLARNKADYLMFLDADEEFVTPPGWRMPPLTEAGYRVRVDHPPQISYDRVSLVSTRLPWRYCGVLHEAIECRQPHAPLPLLGEVFLRENPEGARSLDPQKYARDAAVFEAALKREPDNTRYWFYLAQCYRGMRRVEKSEGGLRAAHPDGRVRPGGVLRLLLFGRLRRRGADGRRHRHDGVSAGLSVSAEACRAALRAGAVLPRAR